PVMEAIPALSPLSNRLLRITTPEGEIASDASHALPGLLARVRRARKRVDSQVERLYSAFSSKGLLRDMPASIRGGRHVLPVLASARSSVPGIVHDRSDTGQTVYVEPMELVEPGNELQEAQLDLEAEHRRIRREATEEVRESAALIESAAEGAVELDCILARARFHLDYRTVFPERSDDLLLMHLVHPLIRPDEAVPNDLELPRGWRVLVISGPNAGGKTVLLKALGLSILCSQSGLGAFAGPGSRMPFFRQVRAVMGDEQSIAQHLSTYSARLGMQADLLVSGGEGTLALIDEPAAGTDPTTGAAIAASMLEAVSRKGCRLVVSTHLGQLKEFAASREGFVNASMCFDPAELAPTYRLRMGDPGSSFAIEMARRIGLPESVLSRARELASDAFERERLLEELISARSELEARLEEVETEEEAQRHGRVALERERKDFEQAREAEMASLRKKVDEMVADLGSRADSLLARLSRSDTPSGRTSVRKEIRELESIFSGGSGRAAAETAGREPVSEGQWVRVRGWKGTGRVERLMEEGRSALVVFGNLRIERETADLTPCEPPALPTETHASWDGAAVSPELDLRGLPAEEALMRLDERLDDCVMAGLAYLRVIHGKGRGILMSAVVEALKGDPRVSAFRQGDPSEGGTGVTIVSVRRGGGGSAL
ncbi:Smr/MutS family protein, partial [Candidatus Fermentibacterales bacterium]|nr:Smr/MutS family protein [Candidatus Fermentibacterales bacterium]